MSNKPRYVVSAGRDFLRFFTTKAKAREYCEALLRESHPNIGTIRIERWNDDIAEFQDCAEFGAPPASNANLAWFKQTA